MMSNQSASATATGENNYAPRPTVHVVDDEPAIRQSLRFLIESMGLAVELHPSGAAFLDRYDPETPGCVVLDVRMPGMNGLDLQQQMRERDYVIPVIILTGYGDIPSAVRATKAGAVEFIEKPVSDRVLLRHIERALSRDRIAREQQAVLAPIRRRAEMLTKRERQVLDLVAAGMSTREIAEALQVSYKTVDAHRVNVTKKMKARNVSHLIAMSVQVGLIRAPSRSDS